MLTKAEVFSGEHRKLMLSNHSTGELIPKSRRDALRRRRDELRRKINSVANQVFSLKYDVEHEAQ